jgi:hypothetical protein
LRAFHLELFTNPSLWRLFTKSSNLVFFHFSCAGLTADSLNPDTKISARIASFSGEEGDGIFLPTAARILAANPEFLRNFQLLGLGLPFGDPTQWTS